MPRSDFLLPLSREHHTALVLARAARKAISTNDRATCLEVLAKIEVHWHSVMAAHFEKEEQLIRLAETMLNPEDVRRIYSEHSELRALVHNSCMLELSVRLCKFADLMAAHVRYEERVLFPQLQRCHNGILQ